MRMSIKDIGREMQDNLKILHFYINNTFSLGLKLKVAGKIAQLEKYLPLQHDYQSFTPRTHGKMPCQACNPSAKGGNYSRQIVRAK